MKRVIVFTRTKAGANRVTKELDKARIGAQAIHGNKSQNARQKALEEFRSGAIRVLVATDIAARGIDVDGITHVVNFELPNEPESYVHRIGRTARAGARGVALSFCDGASERAYLRDIERLTRVKLQVVENHPYARAGASTSSAPSAGPSSFAGGGRRDGQRPSGPRPPQRSAGPGSYGQARRDDRHDVRRDDAGPGPRS
jgi:ATP-dependent RNA helicase RhlE